MPSFSATDAAFAGFRVLRDNPMIVVMWSLVSLVFALAAVVLLFIVLGSSFMQLAQLGESGEPSPEMMAGLFLRMIPALLLMIPLALVYSGVMIAGVNRAVMTPQDKGFFYLKLGAEELRQAVILFVQGLAWFGVYIIGVIIVVMTVGVSAIGAAAASGDASSIESMGPAIGMIFVVGLALLALAAFLGVKFSLASALSFDKRRIDIFGAWSLSNGRFWPMFGAYILAGVFSMMIYIGLSVLNLSVQAAMIAGDAAIAIVGGLILFVVGMLLGTVMHVIAYSVAPSIYRQLKGTDDASAVFA